MVLTPDQPFPKTRGNVIRSKDWNDAIVEVQRLDTAKVNKVGDTITGSLTVGASLNVGTTTAGSKLELGGNADLVLRATAEDPGDIVFQNSAGTQKGRVWSNPTAGAALFLSSGDITPDLTVDASGNVGIGTTTPASGNKLDVAGNVRILTGSNPVRFTSAHSGFSNSVTNQAEISNDTGTFMSLMIVGNRSGSLPGPGLGRRVSVYDTLEVNGTVRMAIQGDILFKGGVDANHGIGWYGGAKGDRDSYDLGFANTTVDGPVVYGFNGGALGSTSGGQKIALSWDSTGDVTMRGSLRFPNSTKPLMYIFESGDQNPERPVIAHSPPFPTWGLSYRDVTDSMIFQAGGSPVVEVNLIGAVRLQVNGSAAKPGGGSWSVSSDERLKKRVRSLDNVLDRLSRLRGVSFEWKKPEEQGGLTGTQLGLVAQEVEEVFPEWVDTDQNGYKMLTIRGFEALTVEALKELVAENKTLQAKNTELEGRIEELEASASGQEQR
ncbi:MAG TPA: tail fiber domain-containing protein [Rubrobacter sp.]|nr:tail fiber domain-containing protein [Rubrobacter sp.]